MLVTELACIMLLWTCSVGVWSWIVCGLARFILQFIEGVIGSSCLKWSSGSDSVGCCYLFRLKPAFCFDIFFSVRISYRNIIWLDTSVKLKICYGILNAFHSLDYATLIYYYRLKCTQKTGGHIMYSTCNVFFGSRCALVELWFILL